MFRGFDGTVELVFPNICASNNSNCTWGTRHFEKIRTNKKISNQFWRVTIILLVAHSLKYPLSQESHCKPYQFKCLQIPEILNSGAQGWFPFLNPSQKITIGW